MADILPKNSNQASYLRSKKKTLNDNPIFNITQTMKNYIENGDQPFIRSYSLDDGSPKVIAITDQQINDLCNFCCNDIDGFTYLLFADLTFQLGPFYLLLTVYKNTTIYSKGTNTSPVMIGPLMLCMLKEMHR